MQSLLDDDLIVRIEQQAVIQWKLKNLMIEMLKQQKKSQ